MTLDELCENLLEGMVAKFHRDGSTIGFNAENIARDCGVINRGLVQMAFKALEGQGFIEDMRIANAYLARLTPAGIARVESGRGVVLDRGVALVDRSTNIHGDVIGSNLAVNSRNVSQEVVWSESTALLQRIEQTLEADQAVTSAVRRDCLADIETLRRELAREQPRRSVFREILSSLGDISSITSLVLQLSNVLGL